MRTRAPRYRDEESGRGGMKRDVYVYWGWAGSYFTMGWEWEYRYMRSGRPMGEVWIRGAVQLVRGVVMVYDWRW